MNKLVAITTVVVVALVAIVAVAQASGYGYGGYGGQSYGQNYERKTGFKTVSTQPYRDLNCALVSLC